MPKWYTLFCVINLLYHMSDIINSADVLSIAAVNPWNPLSDDAHDFIMNGIGHGSNLIHQPSLYGVALAKLLFMRRNLLLNGRDICRKRGIMYGKMEKKKGTQGGITALDSNNHCRFRIIMPIHCLLP